MPSLQIPAYLHHLAKTPQGQQWLEQLPQVFASLCQQWHLQYEFTYLGGSAALVTAVRRSHDDEPLVLKIQWPHPECEHEALALRAWQGNGVVRLLRHHAEHHALLLDRCVPGSCLGDAIGEYDNSSECLDVIADLLQRTWIPTHEPITRLCDAAEEWLRNLLAYRQRAAREELDLIDLALDYLPELIKTSTNTVLVNQDLHGANILSSNREAWLIIDPKPLIGEREFGLVSIVKSFELGHSNAEVLNRLDYLSDTLQLDRERVRRWAIVHGMAMTLGDSALSEHREVVKWLAGAG